MLHDVGLKNVPISQSFCSKEFFMDQQQTSVIRGCADLSIRGQISFSDMVGKLSAIGLERFHADYSRNEATYYMPDGESLTIHVEHAAAPIARKFSAKDIETAARQAERGEIAYMQFIKQTTAAGCVGYFAQIAGRQTIYFGRNGEQHVEKFPSAAPGAVK
jgi:uncharacterized protein YbcV (DUF1398 family)